VRAREGKLMSATLSQTFANARAVEVRHRPGCNGRFPDPKRFAITLNNFIGTGSHLLNFSDVLTNCENRARIRASRLQCRIRQTRE